MFIIYSLDQPREKFNAPVKEIDSFLKNFKFVTFFSKNESI